MVVKQKPRTFTDSQIINDEPDSKDGLFLISPIQIVATSK
jgi:hypothetical protein